MSSYTLPTFINKLLADFSVADIESALVQTFLCPVLTKRVNNRLIQSLLDSNPTIDKLNRLLREHDGVPTLKALENAFELLIPEIERKLNGAFFTPQFIVDYMVTELVSAPDQRVIDCSCGSGAFLVSALERLQRLTQRTPAHILRENIFGVDLLPSNVRRTQIMLSLFALLNGEDTPELALNVVCHDSLTANWQKVFPTVMTTGGFDVVLGNPPYVKFQDLDAGARVQLEKRWGTIEGGTFNLYFAFFELGLDLLNANGHLGYVCPNNYFTSLAGRRLRAFLQERRAISKIVDFSHLTVFSAQTYTCITFLQKKPADTFWFERIENKKQFQTLSDLHFSIVQTNDLNSRKWRLLRDAEQANIRQIESVGTPLSKLADIRVGIATLKDQVYFVDGVRREGEYYGKTYRGVDFNIEVGLTRPIVKVSDFKDEEALKHNTRRIICPYRTIKGKAVLLTPDLLKKQFPRGYAYLLAASDELTNRDKGKGDYEQWYAYGRTQGLVSRGNKLLTPTFSERPRFMLDTDEHTLFCNGYGLFAKPAYERSLFEFDTIQFAENELPILQKILNSCVMHYYITRTSVSIEGGYSCYQKNFIERFTIPIFSREETDFLRTENDQIKIDAFLTEKYGLVFE